MAKILVVDDYADLTEVMKVLLKRYGHVVNTCQTAAEVFSKIYSFSPDLVILDVFLENETGRSICHKMKEMDSLKHIPVILFSAHNLTPEFLKDSLHDDFIQKPFEVDELIEKVNNLLDTGIKATNFA